MTYPMGMDRISPRRCVAISLLFRAGNVTTTDLIGKGVIALLQHPEQLDAPATCAVSWSHGQPDASSSQSTSSGSFSATVWPPGVISSVTSKPASRRRSSSNWAAST